MQIACVPNANTYSFATSSFCFQDRRCIGTSYLRFLIRPLQQRYKLAVLPTSNTVHFQDELLVFPTKTGAASLHRIPTTSSAASRTNSSQTGCVSYDNSCNSGTSWPGFLRQALKLRCQLLVFPTNTAAALLQTGLFPTKSSAAK